MKSWKDIKGEGPDRKLEKLLKKHSLVTNGSDKIEWIVRFIAAKNYNTIIHAKQGSGKTVLSMQLAVHAILGIPLLGLEVNKLKKRILIVQKENDSGFINEVQIRLLQHYPLSTNEFGQKVIVTPKNIDWDLNKPSPIISCIKDLKIGMVIWDSLSSIRPEEIKETETEMIYILKKFDQIRNHSDPGLSHIVLHHDNKQGTIRGNTTIPQWADVQIQITGKIGKEQTMIFHKLRTTDDEKPQKINIIGENFKWERLIDVRSKAATDNSSKILKEIAKKSKVVKYRKMELVKELELKGLTRTTAYRRINAAIDNGTLKEDGNLINLSNLLP